MKTGMGVRQSEIFYTGNKINTRQVKGYVKKRQTAFKRKILKLAPHGSVIRGVSIGWNCLTLSTVFFCIFEKNFFLDFFTPKDGTDSLSLNIGTELSPSVP